jgi:hydrogenase/urease accessory protein HupE
MKRRTSRESKVDDPHGGTIMKNLLTRSLALAIGLGAVLPAVATAHPGHAGAHGWLAGALQPLLSLDHLTAGLFVLGVGSVAVAAVGVARARAGRRRGRLHLRR